MEFKNIYLLTNNYYTVIIFLGFSDNAWFLSTSWIRALLRIQQLSLLDFETKLLIIPRGSILVSADYVRNVWMALKHNCYCFQPGDYSKLPWRRENNNNNILEFGEAAIWRNLRVENKNTYSPFLNSRRLNSRPFSDKKNWIYTIFLQNNPNSRPFFRKWCY